MMRSIQAMALENTKDMHKAHIEALKTLGPCPIHRGSFIGHFVEV